MDAVDNELQAEYARVLKPSFWDHRSRWPRGGRANVFIGDAIEEIGRTKFGETWAGNEIHAYDYTPDFPTLASYLEILSLIPSPDHEAEWVQRRQQWEKVKLDREASLARLMWCIDWIGDAARDRTLSTFLRVVDTGGVGAGFFPASETLWNVEPLLERRFHLGHFEWLPPLPSDESVPVFAFFTRDSLDRALGSIESRSSRTPYADLSILSPRLRFAVDFAIRLHIDAKWEPPKITILQHMIEEAWAKEHGTKLPASSAADIARLVKHAN